MFNLNVITIAIAFIVYEALAEMPEFLIIAPQIVCPMRPNTKVQLERSDYSIITVEPEEDTELNITWSIRGLNIHSSTQRDTLILWRKIRTLENRLNKQQSEMAFTIKNNELINGVNYIFDIKAVSVNGERTKTISINYVKDHKTGIQEDSMISVSLISGNTTYTNMEFIIEAHVTICDPTLDYFFIWSVHSINFQHTVNVSSTIGSRLVIPPYSLKPTETYKVICQVLRKNSNDIITEASSTFKVLYRGLKVHLNSDRLVVPTNRAFSIVALVEKQDYFESDLTYVWQCLDRGEACIFSEINNETIYNISSGIPYEGVFNIYLIVSVSNETAEANATVISIETDAPVLQIRPIGRMINQNMDITLIGEAQDVAPSCTLSWYFANEELVKINPERHLTEYGEVISQSTPKYSLQEKIIDDLIDSTYEKKSIQVEATITEAGKARFIADCDCFNNTDCKTDVVFAEIDFKFNKGPKIRNLTIFPTLGIALETTFRIYSKAEDGEDTEDPLSYFFYCDVGSNNSLLLASYTNHWSLDTFLPFKDGGTSVWVVVCDSLGACSRSHTKSIQLLPSNGNNIDMVIEVINGHIQRCELMRFLRVAISAIVSYTNTSQLELATLTKSLTASLPTLRSRCLTDSHYFEVLSQLANIGLDTDALYA